MIAGFPQTEQTVTLPGRRRLAGRAGSAVCSASLAAIIAPISAMSDIPESLAATSNDLKFCNIETEYISNVNMSICT
jgi:hypothetical protein